MTPLADEESGTARASGPTLEQLGASAARLTSEAILERFLTWVKGQGLSLYPAQEEAILEIFADRHVILNTPTGSGKSLVALAMQFKGACEQGRSFYTSPIKALVSEKFFGLCRELGAANVGMLTGDASINPRAPVICCTAEILANMALREGRYLRADYVIMDEFHYYADRDRGMAWQVPLLMLLDATFLLMSATLGDMTDMARRMEQRTGKGVAVVRSRERPVPLDFVYSDHALHRAIEDLVTAGKAPIYLVNFSQREAAEQAQNLTSLNVCSKQDRQAISEGLAGFRFDSAYGQDVRRFVRQGIGVHHAGLLPKYRLLVEQLSQRGLLKVISGTDTLGVGVNIPIRSVLFTRLYKYDGDKTRILSVRDFQQIAGRAGRKGFDDRGSVICQAPEHVVENKALDEKAARDPKKGKAPRKRPGPGFVHYDETTFRRLISSEPEALHSQFQITYGLLMNMLSRELSHGRRDGGYRRVIGLIGDSDESPRAASHHRKTAAVLFRSLRQAGIVEIVEVDWDKRRYVRVNADLQHDFSLVHSLSVFLVQTLASLDPASDSFPLDVLSLVESILENPTPILLRQEDELKGRRLAELKAQGVEYEERMQELEKVTYPKPNAEALYGAFNAFREHRPWVAQEDVRPKSIAREMIEQYASFNEYVREYGLQRSEGLLLRYLSDAYKVLLQTVPESYKTDAVLEIIAYLRAVLAQTDSSLISEWESLLAPAEAAAQAPAIGRPRVDVARDPRQFSARVRAELHRLVKALSEKDWVEASASCWHPTSEESSAELGLWSAEHFEEALKGFYAEFPTLEFNHRARMSEHTQLRALAARVWEVRQVLLDSNGDNQWAVFARIDLTDLEAPDGPLLRVLRIGP